MIVYNDNRFIIDGDLGDTVCREYAFADTNIYIKKNNIDFPVGTSFLDQVMYFITNLNDIIETNENEIHIRIMCNGYSTKLRFLNGVVSGTKNKPSMSISRDNTLLMKFFFKGNKFYETSGYFYSVSFRKYHQIWLDPDIVFDVNTLIKNTFKTYFDKPQISIIENVYTTLGDCCYNNKGPFSSYGVRCYKFKFNSQIVTLSSIRRISNDNGLDFYNLSLDDIEVICFEHELKMKDKR